MKGLFNFHFSVFPYVPVPPAAFFVNITQCFSFESESGPIPSHALRNKVTAEVHFCSSRIKLFPESTVLFWYKLVCFPSKKGTI